MKNQKMISPVLLKRQPTLYGSSSATASTVVSTTTTTTTTCTPPSLLALDFSPACAVIAAQTPASSSDSDDATLRLAKKDRELLKSCLEKHKSYEHAMDCRWMLEQIAGPEFCSALTEYEVLLSTLDVADQTNDKDRILLLAKLDAAAAKLKTMMAYARDRLQHTRLFDDTTTFSSWQQKYNTAKKTTVAKMSFNYHLSISGGGGGGGGCSSSGRRPRSNAMDGTTTSTTTTSSTKIKHDDLAPMSVEKAIADCKRVIAKANQAVADAKQVCSKIDDYAALDGVSPIKQRNKRRFDDVEPMSDGALFDLFSQDNVKKVKVEPLGSDVFSI